MKRIISILLLLCLSVSLFVSCKKNFDLVSTADPTFDYYRSDLSAYLTLAREDYASLTISLDVSDDEVDEYIRESLLPTYATPTMATNRKVKSGDKVYIYYTGYVDHYAFEGGSNRDNASPSALTIGSGSFVAGFEDQLIGVIPAETSKETPCIVNVTFPANYDYAKMAGVSAQFEVEIAYILDGEEKVTDRAVREGDTVYLYYTGYADHFAFDGGSNADDEDPYALTIGSGRFISGFEDQLIGVYPSDTSSAQPCVVNVTFPANYDEELAGKAAQFDVVIVGIHTGYSIPELTEDFVVNRVNNFEPKTDDPVNEFREAVRDWLRETYAGSLENRKISRIMDVLLETVNLSGVLPEGEVETREDAMYDAMSTYYQQTNFNYQMSYGYIPFESIDDAAVKYYGLRFDADWEAYQHEEATRTVKCLLILNRIAQLEGIKISKKDAKNWVREAAEDAELTVEEVLGEISVEEVYSRLATEKARNILLDTLRFDYTGLPLS